MTSSKFKVTSYASTTQVKAEKPKHLTCIVCTSCSKVIHSVKGNMFSEFTLSARTIEYQLNNAYAWISVVKDDYVDCLCLNCARVELTAPRID